MSYQAVIHDATNCLVVDAEVGMQISILQGTATGTPVYVETHTPTTNINGLVSLGVGMGTPVMNTFSDIDWSAGPYFLKTETNPSGTTGPYTITGVSQLLSVPYALYGEDADADPVNEIQNLSYDPSTKILTLSDGGMIDLSDLDDSAAAAAQAAIDAHVLADGDLDSTNEYNSDSFYTTPKFLPDSCNNADVN